MPILDDIKLILRISNTVYDTEINDLISAARSELILSGVTSVKANDDTDMLIKRAISTYAKANFGWNNSDSEKLIQSFESLKNHLSLSVEYNSYTITFNVTAAAVEVDEAIVIFDGVTKYTGADGKAVFYIKEKDNVEYTVSKDGYITIEANIDISASQTISITLS